MEMGVEMELKLTSDDSSFLMEEKLILDGSFSFRNLLLNDNNEGFGFRTEFLIIFLDDIKWVADASTISLLLALPLPYLPGIYVGTVKIEVKIN